MRYFAERSGMDEDLRCSGLDRARDAVKRHVLQAYQSGTWARGEAYALLDDGLRVPRFMSWNDTHRGFQDIFPPVAPSTNI
jgi:hypothetical protein